jgi:hypothetical protein
MNLKTYIDSEAELEKLSREMGITKIELMKKMHQLITSFIQLKTIAVQGIGVDKLQSVKFFFSEKDILIYIPDETISLTEESINSMRKIDKNWYYYEQLGALSW